REARGVPRPRVGGRRGCSTGARRGRRGVPRRRRRRGYAARGGPAADRGVRVTSAPMSLPKSKTKIVATIGPASDPPATLQRLIRAGMNVARVNFSHGDFAGHAERIKRIRSAERATGRRVAIMADLPGPKMRLGRIDPDPIQLRPDDVFT